MLDGSDRSANVGWVVGFAETQQKQRYLGLLGFVPLPSNTKRTTCRLKMADVTRLTLDAYALSLQGLNRRLVLSVEFP
jgi:hypothetical protein